MKKLLSIITLLIISNSAQAETYKMGINNSNYAGVVKIKPVENQEDSNPDPDSPAPTVYASCNEIYDAGANSGNGIYTISNGSEYDVYCYFQNGGWTLAVAQFDHNPIDWNEGIQADYDPTLSSGQSFALNSSELPAHSSMVVSVNDLASSGAANGFNDWFDFQYTTGDIAVQTIYAHNSGVPYHIHRFKSNFYSGHDPEATFYPSSYPEWRNTLTIDATGGYKYTYAFSPLYTARAGRSYAWNGNTSGQNNTQAWIVWVK